MDRIDGAPVTVNDCSRVSRTVEARLDRDRSIGSTYVLQVSSPGERRLRGVAEWRRFVGRRVSVQAKDVAGKPGRIEGTLLEVSGEEGLEVATIDPSSGGITRIPLATVTEARLAFTW